MSNVMSMMTQEQIDKIGGVRAMQNLKFPAFPIGATPFQMTGHFHTVMQMTTPEQPITPSVSVRERRLRLILEEFLELVEANGFELCISDGVEIISNDKGFEFLIQHIEGSRYDLVETADALGDLNVVVAGTGVEFGIPMHFVDYEIYCSNLSKLDAEGNPIVNHCQHCGPNPDNIYLSTCSCGNEDSWVKPGVPIGKILKPVGFTPANIPAMLMAFENKEL